MARRRREEHPENHERWLLTYADLITLLMVFFVVMFAMGRVDSKKYQALSQSLNAALSGGGKTVVGVDKNPPGTAPPVIIPEAQQMEEAKKEVDEYLKKEGVKESAETNIDERGLVISLKDSLLFDSGKSVMNTNQQEVILKIGGILKDMPNYIRVEGHTDNVPIKNAQFSSNWELSAIRATTVVETLIGSAGISPNKISAMGYGEHRPIADNSTVDGRAKNRRVDIVILNSKYNETEKNAK